MNKFSLVSTVTRVTAWLALVIEVFDFAAKGLGFKLSEAHHENLEKLGILLFLMSLVSWLEASNKNLAKLDHMATQLQALVTEAAKLDLIAKYSEVFKMALLKADSEDFSQMKIDFSNSWRGGRSYEVGTLQP